MQERNKTKSESKKNRMAGGKGLTGIQETILSPRVQRPILLRRKPTLPEEIPTSIDYRRQELLFNPPDFQGINVTIVGLGNIGSHTALALARLGIPGLTLYDSDIVEKHNLTSQAYEVDDIEQEKVEAITAKIRNINPYCNVSRTCIKLGHPVTVPCFTTPIVIIAVDSMEERQHLHGWMIRHDIKPELLIDGRVGGNQLEVYCCHSLDKWKQTFVKHPSPDPCGGRFICYVSLVIAGFITNSVKRFLKKESLVKSVILHMDTLDILKS